jgi:hypothetical protein
MGERKKRAFRAISVKEVRKLQRKESNHMRMLEFCAATTRNYHKFFGRGKVREGWLWLNVGNLAKFGNESSTLWNQSSSCCSATDSADLTLSYLDSVDVQIESSLVLQPQPQSLSHRFVCHRSQLSCHSAIGYFVDYWLSLDAQMQICLLTQRRFLLLRNEFFSCLANELSFM